jgi:flagellar hook-length control protein FliK
MVVDGSRYTVESRPQVNTPGDRWKKDGSNASDFSPLLFLILSVSVPPNNAAISDKHQLASLNQALPLADSSLSIESMPSDGAAIGGENGVQAENQTAAGNTQIPVITNAAPSSPGVLSEQPLAADSNAKQSGRIGGIFQPVTNGNEEAGPAQNAGPNIPLEQSAAANAATQADVPKMAPSEAVDKSDTASYPRDAGIGVDQKKLLIALDPASGQAKKASVTAVAEVGGKPVQNAGPNIRLEQTVAASAATQADAPMIRPSEAVDKPDGASHLQNTEVGADQSKLLIAFDPVVGQARKRSVAGVEGVGGKSQAQSGKAFAHDPTVAQNNPDDVGTDSDNNQAQGSLEPKDGQQLYSGNDSSAKTSNGDFNTLVGDKTPHEAVEASRNGVPRSSETVTFGATPTVPHDAAPAAADVAANAWRPVVERVAEEMVGRIKMNKQDAIIHLDPPELGKIKIELHVDGDKLQARILTQGHESQSLIESHLQELRQALQANKLDLVDVRVQGSWHGAPGDAMQGFPQQQQQQPHSGTQQQWGWAAGTSADRDSVEALPSKALTPDKGRVSMWA